MHNANRPDRAVAGILLTGGASRRMGFDKATLLIDGIGCAARVAAVLQEVAAEVIEVGPGITGFRSIQETPLSAGPLAALSAGAEALRRAGSRAPALVLACDLPFVTAKVLEVLARWPGNRSVVPVIDGWPQPLCARWSPEDLIAAANLVRRGARSMRALLETATVELIDESRWPGRFDQQAFTDIDTPADLQRLGLLGRDRAPANGSPRAERSRVPRPPKPRSEGLGTDGFLP